MTEYLSGTVQSTPAESGARPDRFDRVPWGAVALYIVVAFGLAWAVSLPLWLDAIGTGIAASLIASLITGGIMWTPTIATLVVVFLMRTPRRDRARLLGLWPLRSAKRVVWFIVAAMIVPIVCVFAALGVAAAFGWITLDLVNFSGYRALLESQGAGGIDVRLAVLSQFLILPFAGLINIPVTFGEELGWRGWLLPALRPLGTWPALIISGLIWGLWHSPVILLGHNFGLLDWRGVALMTVGCVLFGTLLGWSRLRSGSVWPAVIAHSAFNGAGGVFMVLVAYGDPLNMPFINPLGVSGWIVFAIGIVVLLLTGQFGKEPQLAPKREPGVSPQAR